MRKKLLTLLIGVSLVVALVTVPLMTACAPEEVPPKTVKVGMVLPLSGPAASWGLPAKTGMAIWLDEVNAAGGLKVGDERYLVDVLWYDDEGMGPKTLTGCKQLILDEGVKMVMMNACSSADYAADFCMDHEVVVFIVNNWECRPDRPYLFGGADNWPFMTGCTLDYFAKTYHPKKVAFTCQDDEFGLYTNAIQKTVAEAQGWEIVYNKLFSVETMDFTPIVTAILETDPDLVSFGGTYNEFRAGLVEQLYLQGYTGLKESSEWDPTVDVSKTSVEFMEGAGAALPDMDDPVLPASAHEFWDKWQARFGPGAPEDMHRGMVCDDWQRNVFIGAWKIGVEKAGTFDAAAVSHALLTEETIPGFMGPSPWWGEELFGASQALAIPQFVTEMHNGKNIAVVEYDFADWIDEHMDLIVKYFTEYGLMWYQ